MNLPTVESRRNVVRELMEKDGPNWHRLIADEERLLRSRIERAGRQVAGPLTLRVVEDPETVGSDREVTIAFTLPHTRPELDPDGKASHR